MKSCGYAAIAVRSRLARPSSRPPQFPEAALGRRQKALSPEALSAALALARILCQNTTRAWLRGLKSKLSAKHSVRRSASRAQPRPQCDQGSDLNFFCCYARGGDGSSALAESSITFDSKNKRIEPVGSTARQSTNTTHPREFSGRDPGRTGLRWSGSKRGFVSNRPQIFRRL